MSQEATLNDLIKQIQHYRAIMPEYSADDVSVKEKINLYEGTINNLIHRVKDIAGFADYHQALKFVDIEIRNVA